MTRDRLPQVSDVAVVLGGLSDALVSTPDHLELGGAAERLTEALDLWRLGRVRSILITSGSGDLAHPEAVEAPGLAAWARAQGIPPEAIVVESASRNTLENAKLSLELAKERGFRSFVLITSAYHMPRAEAIFRKAGYTADDRSLVAWPVDTRVTPLAFPWNIVADADSLALVEILWKEVVGYGVYFLQGYL